MILRSSIALVLAAVLLVVLWRSYTPKTPVPAGTIAILGDSITAGYGLDPAQAYPALITIPGMTTENLGVSGSTSADGVQKLRSYFAGGGAPRLVVLALGANDILHGVPPELTEANLNDAVTECRTHHAAVVVCGVKIPYKFDTDSIFKHVSSRNHIPLVPDIMMGEAFNAELLQEDHMHPTAAGQKIIADKLQAALLDHFTFETK